MNTNTFKKTLLILVGVIVVGGIAGYIYLMQTNKEVGPLILESDKTTIGEIQPSVVEKHPDWKTCKSKNYGYEFNYPSNLEVTSNIAISPAGAVNEWRENLAPGCEKRAVFIGDVATLSVQKPAQMTEAYLSGGYANGNSIRLIKKLNINGINTFWFETNCDGMGECGEEYVPFIIFVKNETEFWVDFSAEQSTIVSDIIETFKFTQ